MEFPKNGGFSDTVMIHDENDSIYVRALKLIDIIQSTYIIVNQEIMPECDYEFNIKYDGNQADHIADIIKNMIYKINIDADLNLCYKFTKTDNCKLSITITKQ